MHLTKDMEHVWYSVVHTPVLRELPCFELKTAYSNYILMKFWYFLISIQGLRTLELCVDNLQPDFLYDHIQPVRAELFQVFIL
jgi:hypothetical protein